MPAGVVQNADDLAQRDPQLRHLDFWWVKERANMAPNHSDAYPARLSATPARQEMPAPWLGEHNADILGRLLGIGPDELKRLQEEEVVW